MKNGRGNSHIRSAQGSSLVPNFKLQSGAAQRTLLVATHSDPTSIPFIFCKLARVSNDFCLSEYSDFIETFE